MISLYSAIDSNGSVSFSIISFYSLTYRELLSPEDREDLPGTLFYK